MIPVSPYRAAGRLTAAVLFSMAIVACEPRGTPLDPDHMLLADEAPPVFEPRFATLPGVSLNLGHNDPQISATLDAHIGPMRTVITFDDLPGPLNLTPGIFDDRLIGQGVRFEGISGTTRVGGTGDSGPVTGQHMDVSLGFVSSRVRVHFVEPGTTTPRPVSAVGGFTTTPDRNRNCFQFFDALGAALGEACSLTLSPFPVTTVDFVGGRFELGILFVDIFSPGIPYELDLLSFAAVPGDDEDITPPTPLSASFRPGQVSGVGVGTVNVDVSARDDLSGVACMRPRFRGPSGQLLTGPPRCFAPPLALEAFARMPVFVTADVESGLWTLEVELEDGEGNAEMYTGDAIPGGPLDPLVIDNDPPLLTAFDIVPRELSSGLPGPEAMFPYALEDLVGATSITVAIYGPEGGPAVASRVEEFAADPDRTGTVTVAIPQFSGAGTYQVWVEVRDALGNESRFMPSDLGFPSSIEIVTIRLEEMLGVIAGLYATGEISIGKSTSLTELVTNALMLRDRGEIDAAHRQIGAALRIVTESRFIELGDLLLGRLLRALLAEGLP